MKFGAVPIAEAEGGIVAHSRPVGDRVFKKGRALSADDVAQLAAAGIDEIVVARLEAGDVGEDDAATAVARAACGDGLTATAAFTGRCNLIADAAGVLFLDPARLDAVNQVDEAVTIAGLAPFEAVQPRQMVATIKVIPFAVPGDVVSHCARVAAEGGPLLRVAPFRTRPVGLVQTQLGGTKERVLDKTTSVTKARLAGLGCGLSQELRCAHDTDALAAAIRTLQDAGCELILVNGASAIVDRRDVIPAAIAAAGGAVVHFGMPVDPGNLILIGAVDDVPVLGLPGCARSPKLNGFDWVLQRLLADLPVGSPEIMAMGRGGLLKEIPSRPLPRADVAALPRAQHAPQIAAVVLAGGQSRRMGRRNKLLADVDGRPMVVRAVDAALAAQVSGPVIVVTGHEAAAVRAALTDRDVRFVHNPDYAQGLSTSLKTGLGAVPPACDGALVLLGDMPRVEPGHLDRLIAAFNPTEGRAICVPTWQGKRGNPTLWARQFFEEMRAVDGDTGAKHLIGEHGEAVAEVAMDSDAVLLDVDSPEALAAVTQAS